jgi:hypothetical protein
MQMRLPQAKLIKLKNQLRATLQVKKLTLQELQSIIGSLNFVCLVVSPGRAFARRLIDIDAQWVSRRPGTKFE